MKKATFAALLLSALASGYGITCHAATYDYTQAMGSLELEFSEESGDPIVTIETVNPNNGSTCSFESEGCRFDEDGLTCFSESGDLVLKYRENDVIEVTQEPDGMCGLNATMLGTYVPAQSAGSAPSSAATVYRPTFSDGSLSLTVSEASGDISVAVETVNPNSGHTCSFESEVCNLTDEGLSCPSEDGALELKFVDQGTIEVTAEPSGMCGLRATMIGTYVSEQSASQSSGATVVYRPDDGEGTLSIAVSEESGDVSVAIETVNPNSGHTCSFESEVCNLTDEGLSCPTEDGALELKFLGEGTVEVTAEPSGMCGLRATMLGVYRR